MGRRNESLDSIHVGHTSSPRAYNTATDKSNRGRGYPHHYYHHHNHFDSGSKEGRGGAGDDSEYRGVERSKDEQSRYFLGRHPSG